MRKKLIFLLMILIMLGVCGFYYINEVLIPVHFKEIALTKASEFLNRKITVKEISYNPLKGIILEDLTIYQQDELQPPFIKIEEAYFNIPLSGLIKSQKIIIPSLTIRKPSVQIIRTGPKEWNFSDLLTKKADSPEKPSPILFIGRIAVLEGRIKFIDLTTDPIFVEAFEQTNVNMNLSAAQGITFKIGTRIPRQATFFKFEGHYDPRTISFESLVAVDNLDVMRYLPLLEDPKGFFIDDGLIEKTNLRVRYKDKQWFAQGDCTVRTDLYVEPDKNIKGHIDARGITLKKSKNAIDVTTAVTMKDGDVSFNNIRIKGNLTSPMIRMIRTGKNTALKGDANLRNADIQIDDDKLIMGNLALQNFFYQFENGTYVAQGNVGLDEAFIQIRPGYSLKGAINIDGLSFNREKNDFEINGALAINGLEFEKQSKLSVTGHLKKNPITCSRKDGILVLKSAFQLDNSNLRFGEHNSLQGTIISKDSKVSIIDRKVVSQNHLRLEGGILNFADNHQFIANPIGNLEIQHDPTAEQPTLYSGSFSVNDAQLKGIPRVGEVTGITAHVELTTDQLEVESLRCNTLNTDLLITGILKYFNQPATDVTITAKQVMLERLQPLFTKQLTEMGVTPSGSAAIEFGYKGTLRAPKNPRIKITADLIDVGLTGEKLPSPISHISGQVKYITDYVTWKKLKGTLGDKTYILNGSLSGFDRPEIKTDLRSKGINLSSDMIIEGNTFVVKSLNGFYQDIELDINGLIRLRDKKKPFLDLKGQLIFDASELSRISDDMAERMKSIQAQGELFVDAHYKGPFQVWDEGQIKFTAKSPELSVYGYTLNDVFIDMAPEESPRTSLYAKAFIYDGELTIDSLINLKKDTKPFKIIAQAENINLAKLKDKTGLRKKDVSGDLSLDTELVGQFTDLESITGQGSINIKDGRLWKFNLLKGLWKTLLIPEYENIVFTDAKTNFVVKNKRVLTKDLFLTGHFVDLSGHGWIDFDKNMNFNITPNFKQTSILKSKSIKKGATAILAETEGYINIKVSGTITKPKYSVETLPMKVIGKTTDYVIEGIQGIFEEIF